MLPFDSWLESSGVELRLGVVLGGTGKEGSCGGVKVTEIDQPCPTSDPLPLHTHIAGHILSRGGTIVTDMATLMTVRLTYRELLRRSIRQHR